MCDGGSDSEAEVPVYEVRCSVDPCSLERRVVGLDAVLELQERHQREFTDAHVLEFELVATETADGGA